MAEPAAHEQSGAEVETHEFQAEVSRLLDIVANALYSKREVFIRELISNSADACDRRRYQALTDPSLGVEGGHYEITIAVSEKAKTITFSDNGVGMNHDDLVAHLGTIARSGTAAFLDQMAAASADGGTPDITQIGQFGVGFYSAFTVAESVDVLSRKVGEEPAWRWRSDGKGSFSVSAAARDQAGTDVTLHLKKDAKEFLERQRIELVVRRYADHISFPITLQHDGDRQTLNAGSALWMRGKSEIDEEQYAEFYRTVAGAFDAPWLTMHNKAEGRIEYTSLLFVPSTAPLDLYDPVRRPRLRLYVKRVFITDDCPGLLPPYLRFLRGVVDSEDLPLNISREMLQSNPVVDRISAALVKRLLGELKKRATKDPDGYMAFWGNFGSVLKEGIYEDAERRGELLELARFASTHGDQLVSLRDYRERMVPGQDAIYYMSGESAETIASSPQLEGFRARGVEVLLLSDPVDDFWLSAVDGYEDTPFKSVTQGGADLSKLGEAPDSTVKDEDPDAKTAVDRLVAMMQLTLKDSVKAVRASDRLTESPVCLVADDGDLDMRLERMLRQQNRAGFTSLRILEVNPEHDVIRKLAGQVGAPGGEALVEDAAQLLLDQARIVEGEPLPDPAAFSRRLARFVGRGLG